MPPKTDPSLHKLANFVSLPAPADLCRTPLSLKYLRLKREKELEEDEDQGLRRRPAGTGVMPTHTGEGH